MISSFNFPLVALFFQDMIVIIYDDNVEDLKSTLVTIKTGSIYAFISELLGGFCKGFKICSMF